ncbi:hypothetical protein LCGC14_0383440 [marine sediment metagenome]|uniref:Uncharacterized protein n=1 Tax=marine sediment metagenome TaxID=412755 RepID=A0A0F9T1L3_9ZZZZ
MKRITSNPYPIAVSLADTQYDAQKAYDEGADAQLKSCEIQHLEEMIEWIEENTTACYSRDVPDVLSHYTLQSNPVELLKDKLKELRK